MNIRTNILLRVYLAFGLIMLFAGAVIVQLYRVQFVQGDKWRAMAKTLSTHYQTVEAARGNIFSNDMSLLATSVPEYELHIDMLAGGIEDDDVFNGKVDSLALKLSQLFPDKTEREWTRMLRDARADGARYQLIRRKVTFQELKQVRKFPIFNMGKYKGGLIAIEQNQRVLPFRTLAARTIGYKNDNVKNAVGLEGAYAKYIEGESGKRLMQRMAGGIWMPVNNGDDEIAPKEGADIISTIDVNFQDVAQDALKKQLKKNQADHGCVVLMEVETGEIRAIANFTRTKDGDYQEKLNYAISDAADPGSTFKLATYMTLYDQHKIDTNTIINAEGGKYKIPKGPTITDVEHDNYLITAKKAFEFSSNVAAAKFVYEHYFNNQSEFTDKLYSYHLNEKLGLQIPGEGYPVVKNPKSRSWNKNYSLPEMAYGYEMKLTPLQMLCFYNSVANNGKMIAPIFVKEIRRLGNTVEQFQARVINEKVCSDATLGKCRSIMEGVVNEGNAKSLFKGSLYTVAGKTGTAQIANGTKGYGQKTYQASFCGYFPANHPKYSMIVVINHPTQGDYLAAKVAGPVFKEIADRVYAADLDVNQGTAPTHFVGNTNLPQTKKGNSKALKEVYTKLGVKPLYASNNAPDDGVDTSNGIAYEEVKYKSGVVPNVTGMGLSDALYMMGNAGYKVIVRGSGSVVTQSVTGGSMIPKGSKITIELQ
jgi:cell division protein FtsI (penicillin-binding protein 3)